MLKVQVLLENNPTVEVKPYQYMDKTLVDIPLEKHYLTPELPISVVLSTEDPTIFKRKTCKVYSWTIKGNNPSVTLLIKEENK